MNGKPENTLNRAKSKRWETSASDWSQIRIAILGDIMVDRFIWGKVSRISPEAPVPVVEVDQKRDREGYRLGGAGNVAHNIAHVGGRVQLFGVIGEDEAGRHCERLLDTCGIDGRNVRAVPFRPTTLKTRVVAHHQQIVRFDVEDRSALPDSVAESLYADVLNAADQFDALIVSDYAKGVISASRLPELIALLKEQGKFVAVDPKVQNLAAYRGASLVTPNRAEALSAAGLTLEQPDATLIAANTLLATLQSDALLVTLGDQGMLLVRSGDDPIQIPGRPVEVFDVTGAGDTAIAVLTMALVSGLEYLTAMELANTASSLVVGKIGTAVVSASELEQALSRQVPQHREK